MAQFDLIMPKMGESIIEATILKWLKKEGDPVDVDEPVLEIATDKVDSEVPSPVAGVMGEIKYKEGDVIAVGEVIAMINEEGSTDSPSKSDTISADVPKPAPTPEPNPNPPEQPISTESISAPTAQPVESESLSAPVITNGSNGSNGRFYSPLVMNIAKKEEVSSQELDQISGSGLNGRVTKKDMLQFLQSRQTPTPQTVTESTAPAPQQQPVVEPQSIPSGSDDVIEMDRMRKLIAEHMVRSKQTSAHVTSFVEADVTNMVNWRNKIKNSFFEKEGEKITFTPIFIELIVKAIKDFPMINSSVDGEHIIIKKNINIGMATALPSGHLIVPVIKNTDHKNLLGLTKEVNDLSNRARNNQLKPDEIEGGTFTFTNVGTFGNLMGTPIIYQPQVAIIATGSIKKKPVVIETDHGDTIGIRQMMFLSLSYDHRIIDGFLGGSFLRKVADYFEQFDVNKTL